MTLRLRSAFAALAALLVLAGCTGVPTSSSPQTVEELNAGAQPAEQSIKPTVGAPPRQIVQEFLRANAADPGKRTSARAFLTAGARSRWSADSATIISNEVLGTYDPKTGTVTVFGQQFGTLDKNGIFKPSLDGDGTGGANVSFEYKLIIDHGQYRIDQLRPGLLLTDAQFQSYKPHSLYFYDNANQYLVEDQRYTDIAEGAPLAKWLVDQLAGGPRVELQNAVSSDTLPAQADPGRLTVELGAPTKVEIPGSSQLDRGARDRLAAQLSQTLDYPLAGGDITMTDGGQPVSVPAVGGDEFGPEDFSAALGPPAPPTEVYYLSNGRVFRDTGTPLPGVLGRGGTYYLRSVALSQPDPGGPLLVAGIQGTGDQAQLWVGNQSGLRPTGVRGLLTRPAFAPARSVGRNEVWIGSGSKILRVTLSATGAKVGVDPVTVPEVTEGARVRAVRLSPDGVRIAVVLSAPGQTGGPISVGAIVRSIGEVRIDALEPISPQRALITDVAWLTSVRLFAIGRLTTSQDPQAFDTYVDGTYWKSRALGLSSNPDQVTVAEGASAWVSAGGFVWVQSAGQQWDSPTAGQTPGTAPIYLE